MPLKPQPLPEFTCRWFLDTCSFLWLCLSSLSSLQEHPQPLHTSQTRNTKERMAQKRPPANAERELMEKYPLLSRSLWGRTFRVLHTVSHRIFSRIKPWLPIMVAFTQARLLFTSFLSHLTSFPCWEHSQIKYLHQNPVPIFALGITQDRYNNNYLSGLLS